MMEHPDKTVCQEEQVLADGPYCSQAGDGPHDIIENGSMNPKYMWYKRGRKTYVPVVLDHSYTYKEHGVIIGGLHEISQKTCVEFDIYDNEVEVEEKDYVYITKNTQRGCYSYIGRIGGKQEIGLPVGCISHRTAMHEMLHALGFRHEHVRYDRDDYIIIFWENIRRGRESNFKKRSPSELVSGPYDYESIMHYERKAFSANGRETIRPLKPGAKIGVRQRMSYWDARKVNVVYKCGGSYSHSDLARPGHLSHSPALFRYGLNEDHDHNSSLPIAEYDDFNREPAGDRRRRYGRNRDFISDEYRLNDVAEGHFADYDERDHYRNDNRQGERGEQGAHFGRYNDNNNYHHPYLSSSHTEGENHHYAPNGPSFYPNYDLYEF